MLGGHFKRSPEGLEASLAAFPGAMQGWGAVRGVDRRHPEEIQDSWMSLYFLEEKRWRQQGHRSRDDFWSGWLNYKEPPSLQGPVATGFQTERTQNMGLPGPHPSQPARLPHLQGPTPPRVPISLPTLHSIPMRKTKVSGPGKEAYITQDGEESPIWGGGDGGSREGDKSDGSGPTLSPSPCLWVSILFCAQSCPQPLTVCLGASLSPL